MMQHPPTVPNPMPASADLPADMDVYCQGCGYNLHGLSGDPIRCPECGLDNVVHDLLLPADRIAKQLRRLETAPTLSFAAVFFGLIGHWIAIANLGNHNDLIALSMIWGPMVAFAYIAFPLGIRRFAATCLHQPGWGVALFRFHLNAIVVFVIGIGLFPISLYLLNRLFGRLLFGGMTPDPLGSFGAIVCVVIVWVMGIFVIRWSYRCARNCITPLQRQVAIAMYHREALRKRR